MKKALLALLTTLTITVFAGQRVGDSKTMAGVIDGMRGEVSMKITKYDPEAKNYMLALSVKVDDTTQSLELWIDEKSLMTKQNSMALLANCLAIGGQIVSLTIQNVAHKACKIPVETSELAMALNDLLDLEETAITYVGMFPIDGTAKIETSKGNLMTTNFHWNQ